MSQVSGVAGYGFPNTVAGQHVSDSVFGLWLCQKLSQNTFACWLLGRGAAVHGSIT